MMAGKKRLSSFESNPELNDSAFQSKRFFEGSSFDVHRAQPSQLQSIGPPPLDTQRAELSRQHVRALNTQFASWVQSQLQNHPDELWEDGVQDYLDHASHIKEKFTDIVNWLKANASKGESVFGLSSQDAPKKSIYENKDTPIKSIKEQTSFGTKEENPFKINWKIDYSSKGESVNGFDSQDASKKSVFESKDNPIKNIKDQNSFGIKSPWLKENASKGENVLGFGSQDAPKKSVFENNNNPINSIKEPASFSIKEPTSFGIKEPTSFGAKEQTSFGIKEQTTFGIKEQTSFGTKEPISFDAKEQPTFGVFGTTPSPSWSSGFTTQSSFSFGNQVAAPSTNDASNDADGEEELQQPSSPSVKKTEEKGIIVVHEVKCKLYVKSSDPADTSAWKDKGTGQLSIKCREGISKGSKESKPTILVRNDVGRILLNAALYSGIKTNMQKNSIVAIFHTAGESGNDGENNGAVAQTFLIRMKTEDDRNKLASAIQEYAPAT